MPSSVNLTIDIGGTKVFWALLDEQGIIIKKKTEKTQCSNEDAIVKQIVRIAKVSSNISKTKKLRGVAIALPGLVDLEGCARYAVNLPWQNTPLKTILEKTLDVPAIIENDAKAAALGEFYYGAGKGADNLLYVTIGTGIGGALILGGKIYRGRSNIAGEIGHITINADGPSCRCGNRGCLDLYASGRAIADIAKQSLLAETKSLLSCCRNSQTNITAKDVIEAAREGDLLSIEIIQNAGKSLGVGLVSLINTLDPDTIVLGGSIVKAREILLAPMRHVIEERGFRSVERPRISISKLGYRAGILGLFSLMTASK